ncbi:hypothetical protein [Mucilaginibacter sp. CSA2-8R]|uniref:hypothetical protein n=1 Tax=Mucilaginibacter sp. CSA2-8R TaxID=3141542 RepID=UPI00315DC2C2
MNIPEAEMGKGPILMLNLLKFNNRQHYFEKYIPAFNEVVSLLGIQGVKVAMVSKVIASIITTEGESWDEVAMIEYPDAAAFKTIAESQEYHTIAEAHRLHALADLKLLMTRRYEL